MILLNIKDDICEYIEDNIKKKCSVHLLQFDNIAVFNNDTLNAVKHLKDTVNIYDYHCVYMVLDGILKDFLLNEDFRERAETSELISILNSIEKADNDLDKLNYLFKYKDRLIEISNLYYNLEAKKDIHNILDISKLEDNDDFISALEEAQDIIQEVMSRKNIYDRFLIK